MERKDNPHGRPRPLRSNRLVFPYRLVLQRAEGSHETIDLALPPLPLEPLISISIRDVEGQWIVERIDGEVDTTVTEGAFDRDPQFRIGTAYCRRATTE
jgi:hypothetical protein